MRIENLSVTAEGLPFGIMMGAGGDIEAKQGLSHVLRKEYEIVPNPKYEIYAIYDTAAFNYVAQNQFCISVVSSKEYRLTQYDCGIGDKPDFVERLLLYYYGNDPVMFEHLCKLHQPAKYANGCREDTRKENLIVLKNQGVHTESHGKLGVGVGKRSVEAIIREELGNAEAYELLFSNLAVVYGRVKNNRLYGGLCVDGIGGISFDKTFLSEDYSCLSLQQIKDRVTDKILFAYRYEPMSLYSEEE